MAKETRFFDGFARHIKLSIHTFAPARIISYDKVKQEATVELLFKSVDQEGNAESYPPIEGVPVLGMRYDLTQSIEVEIDNLTVEQYVVYADGGFTSGGTEIKDVDGENGRIRFKQPLNLTPSFKPNDIVFVAFAERALDNLQNKPFDPDSHRTHSLVDAVIIGGYQLT